VWKLFQLSIMAAVMCGNIRYEWTDNPYAAGALGVMAAFFATLLLSGLGSLFGRRGRAQRYQAASHHKRTVGARWDTNNLAQGLPRTWVRDDARDLIEVSPQRPRLEGIVGEAHPLSGREAFRRQLLKAARRH
jgi:hypothetical protein